MTGNGVYCMELAKDRGFKIKISLIPFILLLTIGLIEGDKTVYQKVFKTYMIFIFDVELLIIFAIYIFSEKINVKYILIFVIAVTFGIIQNFLFFMKSNFVINLFVLSVVTIIAFYLLTVNLGNNKKETYPKDKKYLLYFALYFIYVLIQYIVSFFSGEVSYDRNYHLANYIMLLIFASSFYLLINDLEEVKTALLFINAFIILVMIWSTSEFIQQAIASYKSNSITFNLGSILSQFRPKLSFGNTDYFSGYMVGVLPLVFASPFIFYRSPINSKKKALVIISAVTAILGLIPLIFSQTISAWAGIYIGTVIFLASVVLMQEKLHLKYKILIVSALACLFIVLPIILILVPNPVSKNVLPRLLSKFSNIMFFLNDRFNAWSCGLSLFKDHPVLGSGLGTVYAASFKYMNKYFYIYSDSNSFKHSHNEFIEVLGEGGIFGLIFFIALFGFVIVMLLMRAYSRRYEFNYRLICLGNAIGIICMLIHQVFSLSLRMSVTMTMYFFLLGLAIFLISYSKKALIEIHDDVDEQEKGNIFAGLFTKTSYTVLTSILALFLFISLFLFLPLYLCENNVVKVLPLNLNTPVGITDHYLNTSVKIMPGNPYAWTYKYNFDFEYKLYDAYQDRSAKSYDELYAKIEKIYDDAIYDLDRINSIIPGYQDVWGKYAQTYFSRQRYMEDKFSRTGRLNDLENSMKFGEKTLDYYNKSLDMNFLDMNSHLRKLYLLKKMDNKTQFNESIFNMITAKIYLDFARGKRIVKENIKIEFSDTKPTSLKKEDKNYYFTVNNNDVKMITERNYLIDDYMNMSQTISEDLTNFFKNFKFEDNIAIDENADRTTTE